MPCRSRTLAQSPTLALTRRVKENLHGRDCPPLQRRAHKHSRQQQHHRRPARLVGEIVGEPGPGRSGRHVGLTAAEEGDGGIVGGRGGERGLNGEKERSRGGPARGPAGYSIEHAPQATPPPPPHGLVSPSPEHHHSSISSSAASMADWSTRCPHRTASRAAWPRNMAPPRPSRRSRFKTCRQSQVISISHYHHHDAASPQ
jgi:hypothetical protein